MGTGFGYEAAIRAAQGVVVAHVLPHVRDIRRPGSASIDLCWVACGRLDAYYERGVQPWDIAAGEVLVREAGGRIGWLEDAAGVRTFVASGPAHFEPLCRLLGEAGAGSLEPSRTYEP